MKYINFIFELENLKNVPDVDNINLDEMEIGIAVELEHTNNREIAKIISLHHLAETPNYYTKLGDAGLIDEPLALKLYKINKKRSENLNV